jgi:hypothetical protein
MWRFKMKKERTVKNWQIHNLTDRWAKQFPEGINKILTGTVVDDPTGQWEVGFHMRSSMIVKIEKGLVETLNTLYSLEGEEGDKYLGGDIGDAVVGIFY